MMRGRGGVLDMRSEGLEVEGREEAEGEEQK